MKNNYLSPLCPDDDISDSLSTGTNSFSHHSTEDISSNFLQLPDMGETDILSPQTKKIRKKRNAYDKIDDCKRLQLLDAVRLGETLKSASKRLGINYSSAKSILHTYRKEGRILKKSICSYPSSIEFDTIKNNHASISEKIQIKVTQSADTIRPFDFYQEPIRVSSFNENSPPSPMNKLDNTFSHLALGNHNIQEIPASKMHIPAFQSIYNFECEMASEKPQINVKMAVEDSPKEIDSSCVHIPAFNVSKTDPLATQPLGHPLEVLKHLDNFYLNYSNSPLSGGKGLMVNECSDSDSRKFYSKEFDSFSEMLHELQKQKEDQNGGELQAARSFMSNAPQFLQDRLDTIKGTYLLRNDSR